MYVCIHFPLHPQKGSKTTCQDLHIQHHEGQALYNLYSKEEKIRRTETMVIVNDILRSTIE
jgi:hypothetical protein